MEKGESLFCGWKNSAKTFEHALKLCTWKSCFLIEKFDFLAKNTDFPVKKSNFLVKKINFLDDFPLSYVCLILASRIDTSPFPYGEGSVTNCYQTEFVPIWELRKKSPYGNVFHMGIAISIW